MKKYLILFSFAFAFGNAQNQRFSYVYQCVPDSTNQADIKSEMMILEVLPKFSKFYSEDVFKSDSIMNAYMEKELRTTGSINIKSDMRKGTFRHVVIKETPNYNTFLFTRIGQTELKVSDGRKMIWNIQSEKQIFGEFNTQKATTEFAGRKWTAWFTTEIPIQDGPYKFHGLPGLIVKLEDQTKSHVFELKGVKNLTATEIKNMDPNKNFIFNFREHLEMDQLKFKKFFLDNRNDPNKSIRISMNQSETKMFDKDGKPIETSQFLRDREKQQKEKLAKDNNFIELDLLK